MALEEQRFLVVTPAQTRGLMAAWVQTLLCHLLVMKTGAHLWPLCALWDEKDDNQDTCDGEEMSKQLQRAESRVWPVGDIQSVVCRPKAAAN